MAEIYNETAGTLVSGTSDADSVYNYAANVTVDAKAGEDYVFNNSGANVSINTGADNDYVFNNGCSNVTISADAGNDYVFNSGANVSINAGAGNDFIDNDGCSNVTISADAGNDSIRNSYSSNVTIDGGDGKDYISIKGGYDVTTGGGTGDDSIVNHGDNALITGGTGNDYIANGEYSDVGGDNVTIEGGDGDDEIYNNCYRSYDGVHYINDDGGSKIVFKYKLGDGNDVIYGFNETSTLQIGDGTGTYSKTTSGDDIIVTVGDGTITLKGAASLSAVLIRGEEQTVSTILTLTNDDAAKQTLAAQIVTADATARTAAIRITGNALANSILGGTGKDSLYGGAGADSLFGGKGNDKLYGQTGNDYLEGGAGSDLLSGYTGDDTLYGGTANDTLTGGDGNDLFIYTSGKDVITDYEDGDKIALDAAISKSSVNGSDATFTIGSSTLTVKNGKDKEIVFVDATGYERTIIGGAYLSTDATASKATLAAWREVGDATERTKAVRLVGNELDNTILGGSGKDTLYGKDGDDYLAGSNGNDKLYGQNGNDTLWGGAGNDTLIGSTGADVFLYDTGEGDDVISGFDNNDMLLITGAFTASYDASAKSIAFKVGDGSITIKDFTATRFNVNGFKYRISGSKLVK